MAIEIKFLANVVNMLKGTKNMSQALEDVSDSLDDVARDAQRSGQKVEREYDGASRDVTDSTRRLERSFQDLRDTADRSSRQGATSMGNNFEKGTGKAKAELDELGREARANASETFSSFDGSAESFVDGIQGTLGGVVGGMGAIGAAAGAAGAIGLGFITAELQKQQQEADEVKQALTDAYRDAASEGRDYLDDAQIIARAQEIIFNPDKYKAAQEDARTLGADVSLILRAQAGDVEAIAAVTEIARKAEEDRLRVMATDDSAAAALSVELNGIRDVAAEYEELREANEGQSARAREAIAVEASLEESRREQITRTRETDRARYEGAATRYGYAIPEQITTRLELDTSAAQRALDRFASQRPRVFVEGQMVRFGREIT